MVNGSNLIEANSYSAIYYEETFDILKNTFNAQTICARRKFKAADFREWLLRLINHFDLGNKTNLLYCCIL